jgi:hypothetical protein
MLRLGYAICGGALSLLDGAKLSREYGKIILRIAPDAADLKVDAVERRLDALAKALGLEPGIQIATLS